MFLMNQKNGRFNHCLSRKYMYLQVLAEQKLHVSLFKYTLTDIGATLWNKKRIENMRSGKFYIYLIIRHTGGSQATFGSFLSQSSSTSATGVVN